MKDRKVNYIVNRILEGSSVRDVLSFTEGIGEASKVSDLFDYATLLSNGEYLTYKSNIPELVGKHWWLRTPNMLSDGGKCVCPDGSVNTDDNFSVYVENDVRPALYCNSKSLSIGDHFKVGTNNFTVISNDYALCDDSIGKSPFFYSSELDILYDKWNEGEISDEEFYSSCKSIHANEYEYSDVKKVVDKWFNSVKNLIITQ